MSGVLFLFLISVMLLSKVSLLSLLKSLGAMWILFLFLLVIYMFVPNPAYDKTHVAFTINNYPVYYDAFIQWFLRSLAGTPQFHRTVALEEASGWWLHAHFRGSWMEESGWGTSEWACLS
jgi:energy-coupling factor transporter transmembrane protein EcfT